MPMFRCYRGDVDNVALTEDGSFFVTDAKERTWICHEQPEEKDSTLSAFQAALGMMAAQQQAHKSGNSSEGTKLHVCTCEIGDLPSELSGQG